MLRIYDSLQEIRDAQTLNAAETQAPHASSSM
jgi:hypothetical protein